MMKPNNQAWHPPRSLGLVALGVYRQDEKLRRRRLGAFTRLVQLRHVTRSALPFPSLDIDARAASED